MNETSQFKQYSDELNNLRALFLQSETRKNDALAKSATQMAHNQLSCLQTINEFFYKFSTDSSLKQRLEDDKTSILMPGRRAALDFMEVVRGALEMHKEAAKSTKTELVSDKHFLAQQKANLNKLAVGDLSNVEFNRYFRGMGYYYSPNPENEELGDSTVNTIVSEDVWASSPI